MQPPDHWCLSAVAGSTLVARSAGSNAATAAQTTNKMIAPKNVAGSKGEV